MQMQVQMQVQVQVHVPLYIQGTETGTPDTAIPVSNTPDAGHLGRLDSVAGRATLCCAWMKFGRYVSILSYVQLRTLSTRSCNRYMWLLIIDVSIATSELPGTWLRLCQYIAQLSADAE
jgi:hypothetical protein